MVNLNLFYTQSVTQQAASRSAGCHKNTWMPVVNDRQDRMKLPAGGVAQNERQRGNPYPYDQNVSEGKGGISERGKILKQLQELRRQEMEQTDPFTPSAGAIVERLFGEKSGEQNKEDMLPKNRNYSVNQLVNKIQSAKTPMSAGKAVLSATRKVQELKRKLANADGDTEEIELALNHAKRMERVARKKKRHLELEEMAETVQGRDETRDRNEDKAAEASENMAAAMAQLSEDELSDRQSQLDEIQTSLFSELAGQMRAELGDGVELDDEMIAQIDAMVESMTEEEQAFLEEQEELLQSMETVDPHMTPEQLKRMKLRHRISEEKEIVKAGAEYYKGLMKYYQESGKTSAVSMTSVPTPALGSVAQVPEPSEPLLNLQA